MTRTFTKGEIDRLGEKIRTQSIAIDDEALTELQFYRTSHNDSLANIPPPQPHKIFILFFTFLLLPLPHKQPSRILIIQLKQILYPFCFAGKGLAAVTMVYCFI